MWGCAHEVNDKGPSPVALVEVAKHYYLQAVAKKVQLGLQILSREKPIASSAGEEKSAVALVRASF